jgi:acetoin utilization deacetylase AcuC-like enzyme
MDLDMAMVSLTLLNLNRVMIIDLDAHQGNGHETDLGDDSMIKTLYIS